MQSFRWIHFMYGILRSSVCVCASKTRSKHNQILGTNNIDIKQILMRQYFQRNTGIKYYLCLSLDRMLYYIIFDFLDSKFGFYGAKAYCCIRFFIVFLFRCLFYSIFFSFSVSILRP